MIARFAANVLTEHPCPALRLSELLELVAERLDRTLDVRRLRWHLERHPAAFTILDPMRGPWRDIVPDDQRDAVADPWVLSSSHSPASPDSADASPAAVMRESVRWLAGGVDPESPVEVSRWYGILLSEREARRSLCVSRRDGQRKLGSVA